VADHVGGLPRRPGLSFRAPAQNRSMLRIALLVVTAAFVGFVGVETVLDMIHNGVTWLDVLALLVTLLFATGILGSLWEMGRR
jgi:hypothetical protein